MHLHFALSDPRGSGGGAAYARSLADALRDLGHDVTVAHGAAAPFPPGAMVIIDGMLLPDLQGRSAELAGAVGLVHHIAAAASHEPGDRDRVLRIQAEMLPALRRVVATSQAVADRLATDFALAATALPPGAHDRLRATPDQDPLHLLALGVLTRRKRHDRLLRIVARLVDLPWHLTIAGDADREPAHAAELAAAISELGLQNRVTLVPDPDPETLDRLWSRTAVFTLASGWEGYPAAAAEALRRGIPTVVTDAGNPAAFIPEIAGAVVPADDQATFGKVLRRLLCDDDLRRDMGDAAWTAGRALPSWADQARRFTDLLEQP